jgi:hypothetical protein
MAAPVRLLAKALCIELDEVTAHVELAEAPEDFELPMGPIPKGSVAGYRFEIRGTVNGEPVIVVEHMTRIHDKAAPHWPTLQPGGFRIQVEGTPSYRVEVVVDEPDAAVGACAGTAARAINSIPLVCAADPGLCSFLDLPAIFAMPRT